ncbi:transglycosylase domain-containing protein [Patescibacteria group bacterium]|nr:transglycosylase domain-containing protein [Patescibacteria group bacterium]MBU1922311.1 transglycosylase domain-containing protein [Patescibacteria group bacterium]
MPLPQLKKSSWKVKKLYKSKKRAKNKKGLAKFARRAIYLAGACFLLMFIALAILMAWYGRDLPDPNNLQARTVAQSTQIFDRTGENLLYEIHGDENRTLIKIEELPEYVVWATIVTEDRDFYKHHGFNIQGIARSVLLNIFKGTRVGGSTITQQFVKNSILSTEKTYARKLKELILSIQIERKFTKDQILQLYFNEIPYGSTNYGIEAASQNYFGHTAKELSLTEAATLAALPQAPTKYLNDQELLWGRRDYVLDQMAELDYISHAEADAAKQEEIKIRPRIDNIQAPHFVFYVKELLSEQYGQRLVEQGGLKVTTTLNMDYQNIAQTAVQEFIDEKGTGLGLSNGSLVAIDPHSGQILAMVGSKDFFDETIDGQVNVATRPRQPGSSFKPIVYTMGFIKGYTAETILWDVLTTFKTATQPYTPHNYDLGQRGPVSVRMALQGSLNIPAVKMLYLAGIDNVLELAEKMGYSTFSDRSRFGLSLVLGGGEVKLLEHTAAYGIFANRGKSYEISPVLKVQDPGGKVLYEWQPPEGDKVLEPDVAHLTTNILSDNAARAYAFGTGSYLQLGQRPVAAKTGTTNDYRDGWTIGYTPSLVAGVWVGNNDNSEMKRGVGGSVGAAPIWNRFMKEALADTDIEYFNPAPKNTATKPVLLGKSAEETIVKIDRASGKLATDYTPQSFIEEKTYKEAHCILWYVDRDNPTGPAPNNPEVDPQFAGWESAVQTWVEEEEGEFVAEAPPAEYDDLHVPENRPFVQILTPTNNSTVTTRNIYIEATASAPRGISRLEFYIDETLIATSYGENFNISAKIPNAISKGFHSLVVRAFDDIDNSEQDELTINLLAEKTPLEVNFVEPYSGQVLTPDDFPLNISVRLSDISDIKKLDFFYGENEFNGNLIGSIVGLEQESHSISWKAMPRIGSYKLWLGAVDMNDHETKSPAINIRVK